jgi:hypothetical protein
MACRKVLREIPAVSRKALEKVVLRQMATIPRSELHQLKRDKKLIFKYHLCI